MPEIWSFKMSTLRTMPKLAAELHRMVPVEPGQRVHDIGVADRRLNPLLRSPDPCSRNSAAVTLGNARSETPFSPSLVGQP